MRLVRMIVMTAGDERDSAADEIEMQRRQLAYLQSERDRIEGRMQEARNRIDEARKKLVY